MDPGQLTARAFPGLAERAERIAQLNLARSFRRKLPPGLFSISHLPRHKAARVTTPLCTHHTTTPHNLPIKHRAPYASQRTIKNTLQPLR
jgi:hypothetical protein